MVLPLEPCPSARQRELVVRLPHAREEVIRPRTIQSVENAPGS
jgi:hypothetical protein